jgi:hypothetical protein
VSSAHQLGSEDFYGEDEREREHDKQHDPLRPVDPAHTVGLPSDATVRERAFFEASCTVGIAGDAGALKQPCFLTVSKRSNF